MPVELYHRACKWETHLIENRHKKVPAFEAGTGVSRMLIENYLRSVLHLVSLNSNLVRLEELDCFHTKGF